MQCLVVGATTQITDKYRALVARIELYLALAGLWACILGMRKGAWRLIALCLSKVLLCLSLFCEIARDAELKVWHHTCTRMAMPSFVLRRRQDATRLL